MIHHPSPSHRARHGHSRSGRPTDLSDRLSHARSRPSLSGRPGLVSVSTSGAATTRPSETASRTARPPAAGQGMFVSDRECAPGPIARLQVIFSGVPRRSSGGHSVRRSLMSCKPQTDAARLLGIVRGRGQEDERRYAAPARCRAGNRARRLRSGHPTPSYGHRYRCSHATSAASSAASSVSMAATNERLFADGEAVSIPVIPARVAAGPLMRAYVRYEHAFGAALGGCWATQSWGTV